MKRRLLIALCLHASLFFDVYAAFVMPDKMFTLRHDITLLDTPRRYVFFYMLPRSRCCRDVYAYAMLKMRRCCYAALLLLTAYLAMPPLRYFDAMRHCCFFFFDYHVITTLFDADANIAFDCRFFMMPAATDTLLLQQNDTCCFSMARIMK